MNLIKTKLDLWKSNLNHSSLEFLEKNIHLYDQKILRILGKEYVISDKSDNLITELISGNNKLKLENGKNVNDIVKGSLVNIKRNEEEKVIMIEILFNMLDKDRGNIKVKENYFDPVFNFVELSFDNANDGFADVRIGGNC